MTDDQWIVVPNWDRFQHYSDREPIWIKVYLELRDKPEWEALNYTERGLLVSIWMEFAASRGQVSCRRLRQKTGQITRSEHLASLNHAGFIQILASKPLALARSREVEVEREKKVLSAHAQKQPVDNPAGRTGENVPMPTGKAAIPMIERMIRNGVIQHAADLEAELSGAKLNSTDADNLRAQLNA